MVSILEQRPCWQTAPWQAPSRCIWCNLHYEVSDKRLVHLVLQAHGKEAAEVLDRRKVQHQKAEDLRRAVERRLRLRCLSHDPAVSHDR